MRLTDIEMLSTTEESVGKCNESGGWCFIGGQPQKGMHILRNSL